MKNLNTMTPIDDHDFEFTGPTPVEFSSADPASLDFMELDPHDPQIDMSSNTLPYEKQAWPDEKHQERTYLARSHNLTLSSFSVNASHHTFGEAYESEYSRETVPNYEWKKVSDHLHKLNNSGEIGDRSHLHYPDQTFGSPYMETLVSAAEPSQQQMGYLTKPLNSLKLLHSKATERPSNSNLNLDLSDAAEKVPINGRRSRRIGSERVGIFACPFFKKDPVKHRTCRTYGFRNVSALKLHTLRTHHIASASTTHEYQAFPLLFILPPKNDNKPSNEWFDIFNILFPGESIPDTCYVYRSIKNLEVIGYMPIPLREEISETGALYEYTDGTPNNSSKKWICIQPSGPRKLRASPPLSECKLCSLPMKYDIYYKAVAHLRRSHFANSKRGTKRSWPAITELNHWVMQVNEQDADYKLRQEELLSSYNSKAELDGFYSPVANVLNQDIHYSATLSPLLDKSMELSEPMDRDMNQISKRAGLKDIEVKSVVPFTDSGYNSAPNIGHYPGAQIDPGQSLVSRQNSRATDGHDENDEKTMYSIGSTVDICDAQKYIVDLANDMSEKLRRHGIGPKEKSVLAKLLPNLIKAFALKICHDCPSQENRYIMHFIHKRHQEIATQVQATFNTDKVDEPDPDHDHHEDMGVIDKMNMWDTKATQEFSPIPKGELFEGVEDDEDDPIGDCELSRYYTAILSSPAYDWFLTNLAKEARLQFDEPQSRIRLCILDKLPTGTISKKRSPDIHQLTIDLEWHASMSAWLHLEAFEESHSAIQPYNLSAIMTGSLQEAQGLTIKQYLDQTWPVTGLQVLHALTIAASHTQEPHVSYIGSTQLEVKMILSHVIVAVTGPAYFVADCAELLAWIGSALLSIDKTPGTRCLTLISNFQVDATASILPLSKHKISCTINFKLTQTDTNKLSGIQKVNPGIPRQGALILGFPIRKRPEGYPGLELTFDAILEHLGTTKHKLLPPYVCIKGANGALILAKHVDNIFLWKFDKSSANYSPRCHSSSGNVDVEQSHSAVDYQSLTTGRHIICQARAHDSPAEDPQCSSNECSLPSSRISQAGVSVPAKHVLNAQNESRSKESQSNTHMNNSTASEALSIDSDSPYMDCRPSPGTHFSEDSLDSDMFSMSDSSDSVELIDLPSMAHPFIDELTRQLVAAFRACPQHQSPSSNGTQQSGSVSSTTTSRLTTSASTTSNKRELPQDDEDSTGEDDSSRRCWKKAMSGQNQPAKKSFACPYLKKDEAKHGVCSKYTLTRIRDIKFHLHRKHTPERYCQRCQATNFRDEESLESHITKSKCSLKDRTTLEWISYEQRNKLRKKSKSNTKERDQWFVIWDILFPGRTRPSSVYADAALVQKGREYHTYCMSQGEAVASRIIQSNPSLLNSDITEEQMHAILSRAISQGLNQLYEEWRSTVTLSGSSPPEQESRPQDSLYQSPTGSIVDSAVAMGASTSSEDSMPQSSTIINPPSQLQPVGLSERPLAAAPAPNPVQDSMGDGFCAPRLGQDTAAASSSSLIYVPGNTSEADIPQDEVNNDDYQMGGYDEDFFNLCCSQPDPDSLTFE